MESMGVGFMAVFAVSGSVVLIAQKLHKRLVSDFMKEIEFELSARYNGKKKVKFAEDVMEPSSNNEEYRRRSCLMRPVKVSQEEEDDTMDGQNVKVKEDTMPLNWQILYEGKYRAIKSCNI